MRRRAFNFGFYPVKLNAVRELARQRLAAGTSRWRWLRLGLGPARKSSTISRLLRAGTRTRDTFDLLFSFPMFTRQLEFMLPGGTTAGLVSPDQSADDGVFTHTQGNYRIVVEPVNARVRNYVNSWHEWSTYGFTEHRQLDGGSRGQGQSISIPIVTEMGFAITGGLSLTQNAGHNETAVLKSQWPTTGYLRKIPWLRVGSDAIVHVTATGRNRRGWLAYGGGSATESFFVRDALELIYGPEMSLEKGLLHPHGMPSPAGHYLASHQVSTDRSTAPPAKQRRLDELHAAFSFLPFEDVVVLHVTTRTAADGTLQFEANDALLSTEEFYEQVIQPLGVGSQTLAVVGSHVAAPGPNEEPSPADRLAELTRGDLIATDAAVHTTTDGHVLAATPDTTPHGQSLLSHHGHFHRIRTGAERERLAIDLADSLTLAGHTVVPVPKRPHPPTTPVMWGARNPSIEPDAGVFDARAMRSRLSGGDSVAEILADLGALAGAEQARAKRWLAGYLVWLNRTMGGLGDREQAAAQRALAATDQVLAWLSGDEVAGMTALTLRKSPPPERAQAGRIRRALMPEPAPDATSARERPPFQNVLPDGTYEQRLRQAVRTHIASLEAAHVVGRGRREHQDPNNVYTGVEMQRLLGRAKLETDLVFGHVKTAKPPRLYDQFAVKDSTVALKLRWWRRADARQEVIRVLHTSDAVQDVRRAHHANPDWRLSDEAMIEADLIDEFARDPVWSKRLYKIGRGATARTAGAGKVGISFFRGRTPEEDRTNRWLNLIILVHEYVHMLTDPGFAGDTKRLGAGPEYFTRHEGITDRFTEIVVQRIRAKLERDDPELRDAVEGGTPYRSLPPIELFGGQIRPRYKEYYGAVRLEGIVGLAGLMDAYLFGAAGKIGAGLALLPGQAQGPRASAWPRAELEVVSSAPTRTTAVSVRRDGEEVLPSVVTLAPGFVEDIAARSPDPGLGVFVLDALPDGDGLRGLFDPDRPDEYVTVPAAELRGRMLGLGWRAGQGVLLLVDKAAAMGPDGALIDKVANALRVAVFGPPGEVVPPGADLALDTTTYLGAATPATTTGLAAASPATASSPDIVGPRTGDSIVVGRAEVSYGWADAVRDQLAGTVHGGAAPSALGVGGGDWVARVGGVRVWQQRLDPLVRAALARRPDSAGADALAAWDSFVRAVDVVDQVMAQATVGAVTAVAVGVAFGNVEQAYGLAFDRLLGLSVGWDFLPMTAELTGRVPEVSPLPDVDGGRLSWRLRIALSALSRRAGDQVAGIAARWDALVATYRETQSEQTLTLLRALVDQARAEAGRPVGVDGSRSPDGSMTARAAVPAQPSTGAEDGQRVVQVWRAEVTAGTARPPWLRWVRGDDVVAIAQLRSVVARVEGRMARVEQALGFALQRVLRHAAGTSVVDNVVAAVELISSFGSAWAPVRQAIDQAESLGTPVATVQDIAEVALMATDRAIEALRDLGIPLASVREMLQDGGSPPVPAVRPDWRTEPLVGLSPLSPATGFAHGLGGTAAAATGPLTRADVADLRAGHVVAADVLPWGVSTLPRVPEVGETIFLAYVEHAADVAATLGDPDPSAEAAAVRHVVTARVAGEALAVAWLVVGRDGTTPLVTPAQWNGATDHARSASLEERLGLRIVPPPAAAVAQSLPLARVVERLGLDAVELAAGFGRLPDWHGSLQLADAEVVTEIWQYGAQVLGRLDAAASSSQVRRALLDVADMATARLGLTRIAVLVAPATMPRAQASPDDKGRPDVLNWLATIRVDQLREDALVTLIRQLGTLELAYRIAAGDDPGPLALEELVGRLREIATLAAPERGWEEQRQEMWEDLFGPHARRNGARAAERLADAVAALDAARAGGDELEQVTAEAEYGQYLQSFALLPVQRSAYAIERLVRDAAGGSALSHPVGRSDGFLRAHAELRWRLLLGEDPLPFDGGKSDGLAYRYPVTVTLRLMVPRDAGELGQVRTFGERVELSFGHVGGDDQGAREAELTLRVVSTAEFWQASGAALAAARDIAAHVVGGVIRVGTAAFGADVPAYLHLIELFHAHQDVLARMWQDPRGDIPGPVVGRVLTGGTPIGVVYDFGVGLSGALAVQMSYRADDHVAFTVSGLALEAGILRAQIAVASGLVGAAHSRASAQMALQGWPAEAVGSHRNPFEVAHSRAGFRLTGAPGPQDTVTARRLIELLDDRAGAAALFHLGAWPATRELGPPDEVEPFAGLAHLRDELLYAPSGVPLPDLSDDVRASAARAFADQDPFVTVVRTLNRDAVLAPVVSQHPVMAGADAYWRLLRGVLAVPTDLFADAARSLGERVEALGPTASVAGLKEVFRPDPRWDALATDERALVEIMPDVAVVRDLGWLDLALPGAESTEEVMATAPATLSDVPRWVRERIASGKPPVPLLDQDIADEAASLMPLGVEIEFGLAVNDPTNPWTYVPREVRRKLIGRALFAAGLTRTPVQELHHTNEGNPTTAVDGWKYETEHAGDGEAISPIYTLTARSQRAAAKVVEIIKFFGGVPQERPFHIHRGVGVLGEIVRPAGRSSGQRLRAFRSRVDAIVGRARRRPAEVDADYLVTSSQIIDHFVEELLRISTNPAADHHRGTHYANPFWSPAVGVRSHVEAVIEGRRGDDRGFLNYNPVDGGPGGHDEFRGADVTLVLAFQQTVAKVLAGLGVAALRGDLPVMSPSPPAAPLGRFDDPLSELPPRTGGWRVFDLETQVEADRLAEFLHTAFSDRPDRRVDMLQAAALFVLNPWISGDLDDLSVPDYLTGRRFAARTDAGPRPPAELALLVADAARWLGLSYPREVILRLSSIPQLLDRIRGDAALTAAEIYRRALLPSADPDSVMSDDGMRGLYEALGAAFAAVAVAERPRWLMDRISARREQWRRFADDTHTPASAWRTQAPGAQAAATRHIAGGHWLTDASQPDAGPPPGADHWPHLEGMVTVAGRLRADGTLGGWTAGRLARWLNDTYPAHWPGFRGVLLPVVGSGNGQRRGLGGQVASFGAQLRTALRALGHREQLVVTAAVGRPGRAAGEIALPAAATQPGRWKVYPPREGPSRVIEAANLDDVGRLLGHRVVPWVQPVAEPDGVQADWPAGGSLPPAVLQRLRAFPLDALAEGGATASYGDLPRPPVAQAALPERLRRAITQAFPALAGNPVAAVWQTLPVSYVIGDMAMPYSGASAAQLYDLLVRGEISVPATLLGYRIEWLNGQLAQLGEDPDPSVVQALLAPTAEWRSFAVDHRRIAEALAPAPAPAVDGGAEAWSVADLYRFVAEGSVHVFLDEHTGGMHVWLPRDEAELADGEFAAAVRRAGVPEGFGVVVWAHGVGGQAFLLGRRLHADVVGAWLVGQGLVGDVFLPGCELLDPDRSGGFGVGLRDATGRRVRATNTSAWLDVSTGRMIAAPVDERTGRPRFGADGQPEGGFVDLPGAGGVATPAPAPSFVPDPAADYRKLAPVLPEGWHFFFDAGVGWGVLYHGDRPVIERGSVPIDVERGLVVFAGGGGPVEAVEVAEGLLRQLPDGAAAAAVVQVRTVAPATPKIAAGWALPTGQRLRAEGLAGWVDVHVDELDSTVEQSGGTPVAGGRVTFPEWARTVRYPVVPDRGLPSGLRLLGDFVYEFDGAPAIGSGDWIVERTMMVAPDRQVLAWLRRPDGVARAGDRPGQAPALGPLVAALGGASMVVVGEPALPMILPDQFAQVESLFDQAGPVGRPARVLVYGEAYALVDTAGRARAAVQAWVASGPGSAGLRWTRPARVGVGQVVVAVPVWMLRPVSGASPVLGEAVDPGPGGVAGLAIADTDRIEIIDDADLMRVVALDQSDRPSWAVDAVVAAAAPHTAKPTAGMDARLLDDSTLSSRHASTAGVPVPLAQLQQVASRRAEFTVAVQPATTVPVTAVSLGGAGEALLAQLVAAQVEVIETLAAMSSDPGRGVFVLHARRDGNATTILFPSDRPGDGVAVPAAQIRPWLAALGWQQGQGLLLLVDNAAKWLGGTTLIHGASVALDEPVAGLKDALPPADADVAMDAVRTAGVPPRLPDGRDSEHVRLSVGAAGTVAGRLIGKGRSVLALLARARYEQWRDAGMLSAVTARPHEYRVLVLTTDTDSARAVVLLPDGREARVDELVALLGDANGGRPSGQDVELVTDGPALSIEFIRRLEAGLAAAEAASTRVYQVRLEELLSRRAQRGIVVQPAPSVPWTMVSARKDADRWLRNGAAVMVPAQAVEQLAWSSADPSLGVLILDALPTTTGGVRGAFGVDGNADYVEVGGAALRAWLSQQGWSPGQAVLLLVKGATTRRSGGDAVINDWADVLDVPSGNVRRGRRQRAGATEVGGWSVECAGRVGSWRRCHCHCTGDRPGSQCAGAGVRRPVHGAARRPHIGWHPPPDGGAPVAGADHQHRRRGRAVAWRRRDGGRCAPPRGAAVGSREWAPARTGRESRRRRAGVARGGHGPARGAAVGG